MKRFIIADGVIQGILAFSIIASITYAFSYGELSNLPILYAIYVLLGWQLVSSLIHVAEKRKLQMNKRFYYLQLMLLGYCLFIGVAFIATRWVVFSDIPGMILGYLFFGGMFTLLPAFMLGIAFFTTKRMFMLLQQPAG